VSRRCGGSPPRHRIDGRPVQRDRRGDRGGRGGAGRRDARDRAQCRPARVEHRCGIDAGGAREHGDRRDDRGAARTALGGSRALPSRARCCRPRSGGWCCGSTPPEAAARVRSAAAHPASTRTGRCASADPAPAGRGRPLPHSRRRTPSTSRSAQGRLWKAARSAASS
jgi:hypothetical protein